MGWMSCPLYNNSATWMIAHICSHHPFTNDPARDVDMYHGYDLARLSKLIKHKKRMKIGVHIYLFIIQLLFATFALCILYPTQCLFDLFFGKETVFKIVPNKNNVVYEYLIDTMIQLALSILVLVGPSLINEGHPYRNLLCGSVPFFISSILFVFMTQSAHLSPHPQNSTKRKKDSILKLK